MSYCNVGSRVFKSIPSQHPGECLGCVGEFNNGLCQLLGACNIGFSDLIWVEISKEEIEKLRPNRIREVL